MSKQIAMVFFDSMHLCKLAHMMPMLNDYKALLAAASYLQAGKKAIAVVLVNESHLPLAWRRIVAAYFTVVDGEVRDAPKFTRWFAINSITQSEVKALLVEAYPTMQVYSGSMAAQ